MTGAAKKQATAEIYTGMVRKLLSTFVIGSRDAAPTYRRGKSHLNHLYTESSVLP